MASLKMSGKACVITCLARDYDGSMILDLSEAELDVGLCELVGGKPAVYSVARSWSSYVSGLAILLL